MTPQYHITVINQRNDKVELDFAAGFVSDLFVLSVYALWHPVATLNIFIL